MREIRERGVPLDKLMELEPCEYLSELKEPWMRPTVLRTLAHLTPIDYTMEQWNYVLSYITGKNVEANTIEDLTTCFREHMNQSE